MEERERVGKRYNYNFKKIKIIKPTNSIFPFFVTVRRHKMWNTELSVKGTD